MWVVNVCLLVLMLSGFFLCSKCREDWINSLNKKEHGLYFLYPFAEWILIKTKLQDRILLNNKTYEALKSLHMTGKPDLLQKQYWYKRVSQILALIFLFNLIILITALNGINNSTLINDKYLQRPEYGRGTNKVELKASFQREEDSELSMDQQPTDREVTVDVKERRYTLAELETLFEKADEYIDTRVLGGNKSYQQIREKLDFVSTIPGTGIAVKWIPDNHQLIQEDGKVHNEDIKDEGITTSVTVILKYYETVRERSISFRILPKQFTEEELLTKAFEKEIKAFDQNSLKDEYMELPSSLGNYLITWKKSNKGNISALVLLGIVLIIIIWIYGDKELEKQIKHRREQMLLDYPEVINKFTLLINAGMTIKQSWNKITEDYSSKQLPSIQKRYVYEEMLATAHELKLGVSESWAYERFGQRTGLIPYMKFSSFLLQNLKKGTKGFTELLIYEAAQAFEQRKETAKRLGEEAGTKLLAPMMVLMVIVFLIIMIPAFMAFKL